MAMLKIVKHVEKCCLNMSLLVLVVSDDMCVWRQTRGSNCIGVKKSETWNTRLDFQWSNPQFINGSSDWIAKYW